MSILIKELKMPKDKQLLIVLNPNGQLFVSNEAWFTEYEAVELPDHGDLIDRDALNATDSWEWIRYGAPVVIPAERE